MKREPKRQFVENLRSGKYTQVTGNLRKFLPSINDYGFCSLGVFCDTINPKIWQNGYRHGECSDYVIRYINNIQCSNPRALHENFTQEQMQQMVVLNDVDRLSLNQIADWVEENIPVDEVEQALETFTVDVYGWN